MSIAGVVLTAPGRQAQLARCMRTLVTAVQPVYVGTEAPEEDRELIQGLGGIVVPIHWSGRFDHALNMLLAAVEEPWTLRVDDDMWLDEDASADLDALANSGAASAYALLSPDHLREGRTMYSYMVRLWRTGSVEYRGRVHERLVRKSDGAYLRNSPRSQIALHHDGYKEGGFETKYRRNLELLELDALEQPDDPFLRSYILATINDAAFASQIEHVARWLIETLAISEEPPTQMLIPVIVRLLEGAVANGNARQIPDELPLLIQSRYHGKPRLLWALGSYFHAIGKPADAADQLWLQLQQSTAEAIDFSHWMDPSILGNRLFSTLSQIAPPLPKFRSVYGLWELDAPAPSPMFTTERGRDYLWIERRVYERLAEGVTALGFRPDAYSRQDARSLAELEGITPNAFEWWRTPKSLPIDARQSNLFAMLLHQWADRLPDTPIELMPLDARPNFRLFDTASRFRKCAVELATWLSQGAVTVLLRPDFRYAEIRRS